MSSASPGAEDLARPLFRDLRSASGITVLALGATVLGLAFAAEYGATHQNATAERDGGASGLSGGPIVATALRAAHRHIAASLALPTVTHPVGRSTGPGRLGRKQPLELAATLRGIGRQRAAFKVEWAALDGIETVSRRRRTVDAVTDTDETLGSADFGTSGLASTIIAAPSVSGASSVSDPGRIRPLARAGLLNGQPAASVGLRYGLPDGISVDAAGVTDMSSMATPINVKKSFKVSTIASIPLD